MCSSLSGVQLSATPWTVAHWLLCPWDSPGKNTGVGCHSLLQGILPTQGLYSGLSDCRQILYCLSLQGSPFFVYNALKSVPTDNQWTFQWLSGHNQYWNPEQIFCWQSHCLAKKNLFHKRFIRDFPYVPSLMNLPLWTFPSLMVVQRLRICLSRQGTWVQSLVGKLRSHLPRAGQLSPRARTRESAGRNERSWVSQRRPNTVKNK